MTDRWRRRHVVRAAPAVAVSGVLAGCPSPGQTILDGLPDGDGGNGGSGEDDSEPVLTAEPEYGGWFADVDNYNSGTAVYKRDTESATVTVGAPGNGGRFAFDHPAVAVSPETTVRWVWSGEGGEHNVVAVDGVFDSGAPTDESGNVFAHRFDDAGTYRYYCEPHEDVGMKGAVTVYKAED